MYSFSHFVEMSLRELFSEFLNLTRSINEYRDIKADLDTIDNKFDEVNFYSGRDDLNQEQQTHLESLILELSTINHNRLEEDLKDLSRKISNLSEKVWSIKDYCRERFNRELDNLIDPDI
jgi:hypothetical protein